MRLKSDIWVMAYVRRCNGAGAPAVVARRGDADAGTIFVKVARLDGTADLYGPAPAGMASDDGGRRFIALAQGAPEDKVDAALARERDLDSDGWVIEVEDRQGRHFLDDWLTAA